MNREKIGIITVLYKFPEKNLKILKKGLRSEGVSQKDIYVADNTHKNVGYAGAINKILEKILKKYDYFLILNPDIEIKKGFIKELIKESHLLNVGIVGPKILDKKGKIWSMGGVIDKNRYSGGLADFNKEFSSINKPVCVDFIPGTAMLVKKEVFEKIGLFQEDYFLYYEDVDFSIRATSAGYKNVIVPNATIVHFASSSVGKNSPTMNYYMSRNHLLFLERFAPLKIKIREIVRLPKTLYEARRDKYELLGIRDYLLRNFGRNKDIKSKADNI